MIKKPLIIHRDLANVITVQEPCEDCISRTEAINAIHTTMHKYFNTSDDPEPFNDTDKLLLNLNKAITKAIKDLQPMGWYEIIHGTPLTSDVTDINVGNKNCILDKIRAEIESCREDVEPHLVDYRYYRNEGLDMALDIIDKHNSESEE